MDIQILDISDELEAYQEALEVFLADLGPELEFMDPDFGITKLMRSELVVVALDENGGIVGLNATTRRFGMNKAYSVVGRRFQGKGLGKRLFLKRNHIAREEPRCNLVLGVVDGRNSRSLNMCLHNGHRVIGKRWDLCYMAMPVSFKGHVLFYLFRAIFPVIRVFDKLSSIRAKR